MSLIADLELRGEHANELFRRPVRVKHFSEVTVDMVMVRATSVVGNTCLMKTPTPSPRWRHSREMG